MDHQRQLRALYRLHDHLIATDRAADLAPVDRTIAHTIVLIEQNRLAGTK